jgi:hypothetical protein
MPTNPFEPPQEVNTADGPQKLPPLFWIVATAAAMAVAAPALITIVGFALVASGCCSFRS